MVHKNDDLTWSQISLEVASRSRATMTQQVVIEDVEEDNEDEEWVECKEEKEEPEQLDD